MFEKLKIKRDYKKINQLFDYFIKNEFNRHKDKIELDGLYSTDVFVDVFSQRIIKNKINMYNIISIIEYFLFSSDELKINIIKKVLEKVYNNDNFVNSYCTSFFRFSRAYNLSKLKFNILIPVFIKIIDSHINKLSIDILGLVIHNINNDVILEEEYINQLIDLMNKKIDIINENFDNKSNVKDQNVSNYYCEIIRLSRRIYNKKTIELFKKIDINKLPDNIKLKVVEFMIINNISISNDIIEKMFEDTINGIDMFELLERLKVKHLIPKNIKLTQEDIALYRIKEWLTDPICFSCKPFELKIIGYLDKNKIRYYIFSFKDLNAVDKEKVMIGVSQGYKIGILSSYGISENYSTFDEIENDYIKQAEELLKKIEE